MGERGLTIYSFFLKKGNTKTKATNKTIAR